MFEGFTSPGVDAIFPSGKKRGRKIFRCKVSIIKNPRVKLKRHSRIMYMLETSKIFFIEISINFLLIKRVIISARYSEKRCVRSRSRLRTISRSLRRRHRTLTISSACTCMIFAKRAIPHNRP